MSITQVWVSLSLPLTWHGISRRKESPSEMKKEKEREGGDIIVSVVRQKKKRRKMDIIEYNMVM